MLRYITVCALLTGLLSIVNTYPLQAQTTPDSLALYQMDTLRVEAVRSRISASDAPLALSIVSRSSIETRSDASGSIASITGSLPGIWVNDRQNSALGERITIRGIGWRAAFGVRGIQMVLDGIPLTVADGQSVTNIIDPAMVRRAELIRGPAASYWGNSSGGVLYLSTDTYASDSPSLYLRTYAGSYQARNIDVKFSQSYGNHDITGYTSYNYKDGFRDYSRSKMLRSGINGKYQFSDGSNLQYMGALLWMPQAQHPSGLSAQQLDEDRRQANAAFVETGAGKQVTQGQLGLAYDRDTRAGLLTLTGYGTYRDLANPLPFGIITVDRRAGGLRGSLEQDIGPLDISLGAELKYQHDDRREFENEDGSRGATTVDQLEKVSNQALFVTANYPAGSINILGSLRYDRITFATDSAAGTNAGSRAFQSFSPALGLSFTHGESTIFANLTTSFEAPTTTELVNRPDGGNGFNPGLEPEQTLGAEVGSRGTIAAGAIRYDLALYQLWIRDLLFPYQLEANGPTYYRNQGETRHRGIEIAATYRPLNTVELQVNYTLTDAVFIRAETLGGESLKGREVPGVARHRLAANLTWSPAPFWMRLTNRYVSAYPVNNLNTARNDNYYLLDAKLSYEKSYRSRSIVLTPFINVNNILDTEYNGSVVVNAFGGRYFEPAPGRTWQAGLSLQF